MIRYATVDDLPWLADRALRAYGTQIGDPLGTVRWIEARLSDPNAAVLRGEHAVIVAVAQRPFYDPKMVRAKVAFFFTDEPALAELLAVFRAAGAWAQSMGARRLTFERTNGDGIMDAFAARLGAAPVFTSYAMELTR